MGYLSKTLVASGLVILTGPFCLTALAQDYVDVEAERAEGERAHRTPPTTGRIRAKELRAPLLRRRGGGRLLLLVLLLLVLLLAKLCMHTQLICLLIASI